MLDVTRLRVLEALARHGSVTAAAKELNYTQPTVSHHLARLEAETGAQLLQRAGWADPVADSRTLTVAYRSLERLAGDLRAQGLGNVLASRAPPLGKAGLERAQRAFADAADEQGRVVETFEVLTLSGRSFETDSQPAASSPPQDERTSFGTVRPEEAEGEA